jgi:hypothetical protein
MLAIALHLKGATIEEYLDIRPDRHADRRTRRMAGSMTRAEQGRNSNKTFTYSRHMKNCKLCGKLQDWGEYASSFEKGSGICSGCYNKPFPVTSICRGDMVDFVSSPDVLGSLDDAEMMRIADKMADAYCDNGFWDDLQTIVEGVSI